MRSLIRYAILLAFAGSGSGLPSALADSLTYEWSMLDHGRAEVEVPAHTLVYGRSGSDDRLEWRLRLFTAASEDTRNAEGRRIETVAVDVARGGEFRIGTRAIAVTAGLRYVEHEHPELQRARFAGPTAGLAFGFRWPGSRAATFVGLTADEMFGTGGRRYRAVAGEFGLTAGIRSGLSVRAGARVQHVAVQSSRERTVASERGDGLFLGIRTTW